MTQQSTSRRRQTIHNNDNNKSTKGRTRDDKRPFSVSGARRERRNDKDISGVATAPPRPAHVSDKINKDEDAADEGRKADAREPSSRHFMESKSANSHE
jgi:hypothetical protein